jgi:hypothetical protein
VPKDGEAIGAVSGVLNATGAAIGGGTSDGLMTGDTIGSVAGVPNDAGATGAGGAAAACRSGNGDTIFSVGVCDGLRLMVCATFGAAAGAAGNAAGAAAPACVASLNWKTCQSSRSSSGGGQENGRTFVVAAAGSGVSVGEAVDEAVSGDGDGPVDAASVADGNNFCIRDRFTDL